MKKENTLPKLLVIGHSDNHVNPIKLPKLLIIGDIRHGLVTF
jgi:hypothetical protein